MWCLFRSLLLGGLLFASGASADSILFDLHAPDGSHYEMQTDFATIDTTLACLQPGGMGPLTGCQFLVYGFVNAGSSDPQDVLVDVRSADPIDGRITGVYRFLFPDVPPGVFGTYHGYVPPESPDGRHHGEAATLTISPGAPEPSTLLLAGAPLAILFVRRLVSSPRNTKLAKC